MVKIVAVVPAERAALHDVVPHVMETFAGPEGLCQIPVEDAARMSRQTTTKKERAGGRKVNVGHVVARELEAARRRARAEIEENRQKERETRLAAFEQVIL